MTRKPALKPPPLPALRLRLETKAAWIELGGGAAVHATPPTTITVYAARAEAERLLIEAMESGEAVTRLGGRIEGLPDLSNPAAARAAQDALFVVALGEMIVTDWRGIGSAEGTALDFDPSLLGDLFQNHVAADRFLRHVMHPLNQVAAAGNA